MAHIIDFISARVDFSKYGEVVKGVTYSPTVSDKLPAKHRSNKNEYLKGRGEFFMSIDLDYHKAASMSDREYDQYILSGLIGCLERPEVVEGFDQQAFREDILEMIEALSHQAA